MLTPQTILGMKTSYEPFKIIQNVFSKIQSHGKGKQTKVEWRRNMLKRGLRRREIVEERRGR